MQTQVQQLISCLGERTFSNPDSIVEVLFDHYGETVSTGSKAISDGFDKLRKQLNISDKAQEDEVMTTVFDLCRDHEFVAFKNAIRIGYQLAHELDARGIEK